MLSFFKKIFFSLPDFHKHPETIFDRGWGNSLKGA